MYRATTRAIAVSVRPEYSEAHSEPEEDRYFWLYTVEITNGGRESVQVLARHWLITDAEGMTQEVRGTGVVGEQPIIPPGETFRYTSGCPLSTPTGIMVGTYSATTVDGEAFDIDIPAFSLDCPAFQPVIH